MSCHYCRHCHCHCRCHHYCRHCHCYHHFRRHHCKYHRKAEERICAETMSSWLCLCGTGTDIDRKTKTNIILVIIIVIVSRSSSSSLSTPGRREDESRLVVLVVPLRRSWQNPAPCAVGPRLLGRREAGVFRIPISLHRFPSDSSNVCLGNRSLKLGAQRWHLGQVAGAIAEK